jgi:predicted flap endonuclease-1-like 5' DNA nuclease
MGYLLTEIVVYLVIAGLIGFAFGWLVRDGALDKYFDKLIGFIKMIWSSIIGLFGKVKELWNAYYLTLTTSKKVVEEPNAEVQETKEEVAPAKVAEVIKEEVKIEEPLVEEPKAEVLEETVTEIAKDVEVLKVEEPKVSTSEETNSPVLLTEAPESGADKLSSIKGIGPVLEKKLNELGVYSFEQIASWDAAQELWIGTQMAFPKRVTKEEWVKQAKELLKNK